jgi:hypothetical protein
MLSAADSEPRVAEREPGASHAFVLGHICIASFVILMTDLGEGM